MDKRIKLSILSIFLAAVLIGSVVAYGDNMIYAGGKNKNHNGAQQLIEQFSNTIQQSSCVSGSDTVGSCNNFNTQSQTNYGNNALSQSR